MNKVVANAEEAIQDVFEAPRSWSAASAVRHAGEPDAALVRKGIKNLTTISNNVGVDGFGMGLLLANGQFAATSGRYVGENKLLEADGAERHDPA